MGILQRGVLTAAACLALSTAAAFSAPQKNDKDDQRPKLLLHAQPPVSIAPSRVVLTAEMVGGANDFEEYYCPGVEWDWGDDTRSESTIDCDPYEAGKSEIKRRFTVEHVFRRPGNYKVFFRLKRRGKTVATASANVQVRPGVSPQ
jgi:hypothetical protein